MTSAAASDLYLDLPDLSGLGLPDLSTLPTIRAAIPPPQFRDFLRRLLLASPRVTLRQVAGALGVTRQAVGQMVGPLNRPSCTERDRPAPRKEEARRRLAELSARVAAGESAESAARSLGISLGAAGKLGWRAKSVRPVHGSSAGVGQGCDCWRCRRASGIALPRGRRLDPTLRAQVIDLLAWTDPDDGSPLSLATIGRLAGVGPAVVSRIAQAASNPAK